MKFSYLVPAGTYGGKKGYFKNQVGTKDHLGATIVMVYEEQMGDKALYSVLMMEGPFKAYREYKKTFKIFWLGWPKIFILKNARKNRKHYNEADNAR